MTLLPEGRASVYDSKFFFASKAVAPKSCPSPSLEHAPRFLEEAPKRKKQEALRVK